MAQRRGVDPLEPVLEDVERELNGSLAKACRKRDVREATTAEIERLGDTLLVAARQAKAAAGLRRRIKAAKTARDLRPGADPSASA